MKKLLTIVCVLLFIVILVVLVVVGKNYYKNEKIEKEVEEIAELKGWDVYCYTVDETSVKGVYLVHIYNDENLYVYTIKGDDHWCVYWE